MTRILAFQNTNQWWSQGSVWVALLVWSMAVLVIQGNDTPPPASGIDLGVGIVTQTNVQSYMDLSQDIMDIKNFWSSGQFEEAKGLYQTGKHSESSPGVLRSLASLGEEMASATPRTPSFLYHVYGELQLDFNAALDGTKLSYVNDFVLRTLDEASNTGGSSVVDDPTDSNNNMKDPVLQAIWSVNLYMYATHLLFTGVYNCERHSLAQEAAIFDVGTANWDQFMALYVGSGQTLAQANGYSLYTWAQELGDAMGTSDPEASVNSRIKLLYQEAMTKVNVEGACNLGEDKDTAGELWKLAVEVVGELSQPLFQGLVHALTKSRNTDLVRLYARALVPQMSKCRPSLYKRLYGSLIEQPSINLDDRGWVQTILDDIPEATSCFGYSCGDLGDTGIDACQYNFESYLSYAGYVPTTPVRAVGMADLDIYQIKILVEMQARQFAMYVYMHGANIAKYGLDRNTDPLNYVSLHDIAVTTERENANPWFDQFVDYNGENAYADKVIQAALQGGPDSKWKSTDQVVAIVSTTAAYQVLLLEAVAKLKIAVRDCRDADDDRAPTYKLDPIDETAALLIGSMEGNKLGGSGDLQDGQLVYNVLNRHAFQFGTRNADNQYADGVSNIADLLYAARGEFDALSCSRLEGTTEEIVKYAMVGIAQGCIFLGDKNSRLAPLSISGDLAQAEGLALSIIPIFAAQSSSKSLAEVLAKNLIWTPGSQPVPDGPVTTGQAMGEAFTITMELACLNLGSIQAVNPCNGPWNDRQFSTTSSASKVPSGTAAVLTMSVLSILIMVGWGAAV